MPSLSDRPLLSDTAAPHAAARHSDGGASALLGAVLGAALQMQQAALWPGWVYGVLLCLAGISAVVLWRWAPQRGPVWGRALAWAGLAALLVGALTGLRAAHFAAQSLLPSLEGQDIQVTGIVATMPQLGDAALRLRLEVESAHQNGQPVRLPTLIDLAWYRGLWQETPDLATLQRQPLPMRPGERWQMMVRLKAPHGARNPHGFDYELWLWEQGVQATGYVRAGPRDAPPQRIGETWRHPVERLRQTARDAITTRLAPDRTDVQAVRVAGVVAALVTGDQRAIDRGDWDVFRATSVAHLMSISGLHITLFAWLAAAAVQWLWRRSPRLCLAVPAPSAALVCGVLLAALYALFSGWGLPAQRTVLMLTTVALLRLSGRRWPWPQVWLLACAVVVVPDPWALLQAGFWLSFVAVAVLFATDSRAVSAYPAGVRGRFNALLREQWVVTLALTPLGLLLFGQVSLVGLVANLLAIPWVTLVVTPLALAGVLWAPLWQWAGAAVLPLVAVLQWLAAWPWASLWLPAAPLWAGVAGVAGGVLLALRLPWPVRALGVPLLVPVLLWQSPRPVPGQFEVLAADVGQGNAVLVRTATHSLLYDTGPRFGVDSDAGGRVLVPLLRALGVRLDMLMLSHRDSDHTGGAAAVMAQQPQAVLTGSIAGDETLRALGPAAPCLAGQRWTWDHVAFEVLHPLPGATEGAPGQRAVRPNTLSCVLRITSANGTAALLAGDIESAQEQALVARAAPLKANLLLLPHHGSKTSSSAVFLSAVQPRTALVQAAYRSRFGHPAPEVLQRLQAQGIDAVVSPHCGAATWHSAQPGLARCERDEHPRYWQHRVP